MRLCKANNFSAGDRSLSENEKTITDFKFKIHKFSSRNKPKDKRNIVIFPLFSEFGCETLSVVYCLPQVLQKHFIGKYSIVLGWFGRKYFYQHLVDEFWEVPEEHMWLREYCRAFHHVSKNLKRIEKDANKYGQVIDVSHIGNVAVFPNLDQCPDCGGKITKSTTQICEKCKKSFAAPGLFTDIFEAKKTASWLPSPNKEKINFAKNNLPSNAVGITARHRKTWGRNLEPIFYERLIFLLEDLGYNPVWLGEKITSLPCPFKRIPDFSGMEDLETLLALVSEMKFTIQFWTASSRLAAMMGIPYIIFESPDQIWGGGQEGMRLNLITRGHRKLVVSHYKSVNENNTAALKLVHEAIEEIENNNYEDIIGLVENKDYVKHWKSEHSVRIGEKDGCS